MPGPWRRRLSGRHLLGAAMLAALAACAYPLWRASLPTTEVLVAPSLAMRRESVDGELRVMTLNLAHGRATAYHQLFLRRATFVANLTQVASVLTAADVDIVALQEADGPSVWSGHFDHVASLAKAAGFTHTHRGTHATGYWPWRVDYGTALLSRFALVAPRSTAFDELVWDTKGFVSALVSPPSLAGREVEVVSVHLDPASPAVRQRQVHQLIEALRGAEWPVILLGDFNCPWAESTCVPALVTESNLAVFEPAGGTPTFPLEQADRRIDWILVSRHFQIVEQQTLAAPVSDHRGVVARLRWVDDEAG